MRFASLLLSQTTISSKCARLSRTGVRSVLPRVTMTAETSDGCKFCLHHLGEVGGACGCGELLCAPGGIVAVVPEVGAARRLEGHVGAGHAAPEAPVLECDVGEPADGVEAFCADGARAYEDVVVEGEHLF